MISECCICYEEVICFQRVELKCGHVYHIKCIRKWSGIKKECPLDRIRFRLSDLNKDEVIVRMNDIEEFTGEKFSMWIRGMPKPARKPVLKAICKWESIKDCIDGTNFIVENVADFPDLISILTRGKRLRFDHVKTKFEIANRRRYFRSDFSIPFKY